jgi:hypothetical protein
MSTVIGKGQKFYDIPEDILAKYSLPEEKQNKLREEFNKFLARRKGAEVEGYEGIYYWPEGNTQCSYLDYTPC